MITAKSILQVEEEWFKNIIGYHNNSVPLYINPNSSDLKELFQSVKKSNFNNLIRFVADSKVQSVYIGDGGLVLHTNILSAMNVGSSISMDILPNILMGYGVLKQGKIYYQFNGNLSSNNADPIERVTSNLNSLESSMFRIMSTPSRKDKLIENTKKKYEWTRQFFSFNWNFLDKYIVGAGQFMNKEKSRFTNWKVQYEKNLLEL